MHKRIKDLSLQNKEEKKLIITMGSDAEDKNKTDDAVISDSEFRVLGVKKDVGPIRSSDDDSYESTYDYSVREIPDISNGLSLFDDNELNYGESPLKESKPSEPRKKVFFDDVGGVVKETQKENLTGSSKEEIKIFGSENKEKTEKTVTFKKGKMKFGFSDDDK